MATDQMNSKAKELIWTVDHENSIFLPRQKPFFTKSPPYTPNSPPWTPEPRYYVNKVEEQSKEDLGQVHPSRRNNFAVMEYDDGESLPMLQKRESLVSQSNLATEPTNAQGNGRGKQNKEKMIKRLDLLPRSRRDREMLEREKAAREERVAHEVELPSKLTIQETHNTQVFDADAGRDMENGRYFEMRERLSAKDRTISE